MLILSLMEKGRLFNNEIVHRLYNIYSCTDESATRGAKGTC